MQLMLEPKLHGNEKKLPETLIALIREYGMEDQVVFHSLNLPLLLNLQTQAPDIPV